MKIKKLCIVLTGWLILPLLSVAQTSHEKSMDKITKSKILMVVSSYGKDKGNIRPGFEFDEFTQAYLIFKLNGFEVDLASPKGGKVEPDEFNGTKPYNVSVLQDKHATTLLENTKTTASINPDSYRAIYIVGGKGAMFDLPFDPSLQEIISSMYQRKDAIISAVCHGPAAFVNIKTTDGKYLITGKNVAGFSNIEEEKFGKKWKTEFPFMLEDKLKQRGAIYEEGEMMLPYVTVAEQLITGQNPYSTTAVAEEVVKALGKQPAKRMLYADEKSMLLVKKAITGEYEWAKNEISKAKSEYDIELIAVYGYYRLLSTKEDKTKIRNALSIIELATPYMFNENLQLEMAKGYMKLGQPDTAKQLLRALLIKKPAFDAAKTLLTEIK